MKNRRRGKSILLLLLAMALLCGCGRAGTEAAALKVGVRTDIINFGYYNENTGKYYGMEIDLARELAARLGYDDVEFVGVKPSDREQKLEEGEIDCVIACYTMTKDRQERFDFSSAYYTDRIVVMVQKSSLINDPEQLRGRKMGVLKGSVTALQIVEALYRQGIVTVPGTDSFAAADYDGEITFCEMDSYEELIRALERGEIDAVSTDGCILQQYMTQERQYIDLDTPKQCYGIALRKGSGMTTQMEDALQSLYADGTLKILADKWK